jgi:hypothetical protein
MLKEDQAAELLARCERLFGRRLDQVRGNLRRARSRAAAVWELVCIDAFAEVGPLAHEPPGASSPDIVLCRPGELPLWVEAAYIYPKNWVNERRERELSVWIYREASRRGIAAVRISTRFFGDEANPTGPVRTLPAEHERVGFLASGPVRKFFDAIESNPNGAHSVRLDPYTVYLAYDPNAAGPYLHSSGIVEEQPKKIRAHHLYGMLKDKARQHKPDCPYIVCVGTDQSRAISSVSMPGITEAQVIVESLRKARNISAVIAVSIETALALNAQPPRVARARLYLNDNAEHPLSQAQIDALQSLDFNRWHFYFPLERWDVKNNAHFRRSGGPLAMRHGKDRVAITIPSTILIDCLAGTTSLHTEYPDQPGMPLLKCINEGWQIVGCSFEQGAIEHGLANRVTLELAPPPEQVYFDAGGASSKRRD